MIYNLKALHTVLPMSLQYCVSYVVKLCRQQGKSANTKDGRSQSINLRSKHYLATLITL